SGHFQFPCFWRAATLVAAGSAATLYHDFGEKSGRDQARSEAWGELFVTRYRIHDRLTALHDLQLVDQSAKIAPCQPLLAGLAKQIGWMQHRETPHLPAAFALIGEPCPARSGYPAFDA